MNYSYPYPHPALTVDALLFTYHNNCIKILLIKRAYEPFKGYWAFPGGFVEENEKAEDAVYRELSEETGIQGIHLQQFYTASAPGRDPRGWTVSVMFYGFIPYDLARVQSGDDADDAAWHSITNIPSLAFDHQEILHRAVDLLRTEAVLSVIGPGLLPEIFTRNEWLSCYESITGSRKESEILYDRLLGDDIIDSSKGEKQLYFIEENVKRVKQFGFRS